MKFGKKNLTLIEPYIPGFQPDGSERAVKLNTNENPYPPSPRVLETIKTHADATLRLYPSPRSDLLRGKLAEKYGVRREQVLCGNGSDEIISLIFRTFLEADDVVLLPYPTYSFYKTAAELNDIKYKFIDTNESFEITLDKFLDCQSKLVLLANPNSPTGILLPIRDIEDFAGKYAGLLVVDEAYIDFSGGEDSVYRLVDGHDNILVLRTMSKSFSLCGIRLGYAFGCPDIVEELDRVKDSYNINSLTQAAAIGALDDYAHMQNNAKVIVANRDYLSAQLRSICFTVLPSAANFVFASHKRYSANYIYRELSDRRIYVRHFDNRRISNFLRITVGTQDEIAELLQALHEILV